MWTEILDRVETAADVVEGEFGTVLQFNGRPAAGWDRFSFSYGDDLTRADGLSFVLSVLSHQAIDLVWLNLPQNGKSKFLAFLS